MLKTIPKEILKRSFIYRTLTHDKYGEVDDVDRLVENCYIELKKKLIRNANGDTTMVNGLIIFNGGEGILQNNKAVIGTREYVIFDVKEFYDPYEADVIHHTELILQEET